MNGILGCSSGRIAYRGSAEEREREREREYVGTILDRWGIWTRVQVGISGHYAGLIGYLHIDETIEYLGTMLD
jgi:hypothetical protein